MGANTLQTPDEVEDPGELNQREQIRQLNSAREDVRDVRNRVIEKSVTGSISRQKANTAYRQVISSFVMQLAPYLRSEKYGGDTELWEEEEFGPVAIDPPSADNVDGDVEAFEPAKYMVEIEGIKDLLTLPSPMQVDFRAQTSDELSGEATRTVSKIAEIDRKTLDEIVIRLDEFRVDVGLGLKFPDEIVDESDEPF